MFRCSLLVLALLCLVPPGCTPHAPVAKDPVTSLPVMPRTQSLAPQGELSPLARAAFADRMRVHRDRMGALTIALGLLDYDRIAAVAERIAHEPLLGKSAQLSDDPLIPALPEGFNVYQRELQQTAAMLAGAARMRDDARIAEGFSGVARCCAGCHAAYLHDEPAETAPQPALP